MVEVLQSHCRRADWCHLGTASSNAATNEQSRMFPTFIFLLWPVWFYTSSGISCRFRPGSHGGGRTKKTKNQTQLPPSLPKPFVRVCALKVRLSCLVVVVMASSRDTEEQSTCVSVMFTSFWSPVSPVCLMLIVPLEFQWMLQLLVTAALHEHSLWRCPPASQQASRVIWDCLPSYFRDEQCKCL